MGLSVMAYFGNDLLGAGGEIAVDDEHVILEDNPPVVAMAVALDVAFMEVDVRGNLLRLVYFRSKQGKRRGDGKRGQRCGFGKVHGAILWKVFRRVKWERALQRPTGACVKCD